MRIITLAVAGAGLTLGLAGCTSTGTSTASPSTAASAAATPSAATSGTSSGGSLAGSCVAGNWRGTGMTMAFDAVGGAKGTATGGSGVQVAISPDGRTVVDFTGMQPVSFQADVSGAQLKGQFTYGGKVTGAVQVASGAATSGTWKPVGSTDWSALTVTVDLSSPIQSKIFDNVKIADFVNANGGQAAGSVEAQPILREATYQCSGETLTIGPPPGSTVGGTWVLKRG
jgi:hypothetical protein